MEEEIKKETKNKKVEKAEAILVEVPVQTAVAFQLTDGSVVDEKAILLKIYNDLQIVKGRLG